MLEPALEPIVLRWGENWKRHDNAGYAIQMMLLLLLVSVIMVMVMVMVMVMIMVMVMVMIMCVVRIRLWHNVQNMGSRRVRCEIKNS